MLEVLLPLQIVEPVEIDNIHKVSDFRLIATQQHLFTVMQSIGNALVQVSFVLQDLLELRMLVDAVRVESPLVVLEIAADMAIILRLCSIF